MRVRTLVLVGVVMLAVIWQAAGASQPVTGTSEQEVTAVLGDFLRAFESGDLEAMDAAFSEATVFPRAIMSGGVTEPIRREAYRRVRGLDPQMRAVVAEWRSSRPGPPYVTLEPRDLEVEVFSDAALATVSPRERPVAVAADVRPGEA